MKTALVDRIEGLTSVKGMTNEILGLMEERQKQLKYGDR